MAMSLRSQRGRRLTDGASTNNPGFALVVAMGIWNLESGIWASAS
jgi:hypothetical protein